jgi:hypothetical protein
MKGELVVFSLAATLALNRNRTSDAIVRLEKYLSLAAPDAPNVATAKGILAALKGKK